MPRKVELKTLVWKSCFKYNCKRDGRLVPSPKRTNKKKDDGQKCGQKVIMSFSRLPESFGSQGTVPKRDRRGD
jgi:hypothetical protein